jgi:rRNA maturation endonuclease Nob1
MNHIHRFELFCKECYACELFFDFGKKVCPECGCEELVTIGKLSFVQRELAIKKYDDMWKAKWNKNKKG